MTNFKDALTEQELDHLVALDAAQVNAVEGGVVTGTGALAIATAAAAVSAPVVAAVAVTLQAPACPSSNCTKHWIGHK